MSKQLFYIIIFLFVAFKANATSLFVEVELLFVVEVEELVVEVLVDVKVELEVEVLFVIEEEVLDVVVEVLEVVDEEISVVEVSKTSMIKLISKLSKPKCILGPDELNLSYFNVTL